MKRWSTKLIWAIMAIAGLSVLSLQLDRRARAETPMQAATASRVSATMPATQVSNEGFCDPLRDPLAFPKDTQCSIDSQDGCSDQRFASRYPGGSAAGDGQPGILLPGIVPVPAGINLPENWEQLSADQVLPALLNIPYRVDGFVGDNGIYTLGANPEAAFSSPGLNCSGLLLEAVRLVYKSNIPLQKAIRDRLGDSGPDSPYGEDWDFGWDLLMNISDGLPRTLLLPGGVCMNPLDSDGFTPRGFAISDDATWKELLPRLKTGHVYLLSFSKQNGKSAKNILHYHVGLMLKDESGAIWLYQTTGRGKKSNRRNLADPAGLASFRTAFADSGSNKKYLLVLETIIP